MPEIGTVQCIPISGCDPQAWVEPGLCVMTYVAGEVTACFLVCDAAREIRRENLETSVDL